jgi:parallel beta-helix repeat protein
MAMGKAGWRRDVQILLFREWRHVPILLTPKGGAGFRDGWDYDKERTRDGATMNYTFKLSRRIARLRAALPLAALVLGVACADDPSAPGATEGAAPGTIRISPDSVSLGVNQTVQFDVSTDGGATTATLSRGGVGRGRGHSKSTIVSLTVSPRNTTLNPGATNRFSATATLSDGSLVLPSLSWTATGGTVDSTGLYTAGSVPGTYMAIATTTNGVADTATVTVTASAPVVAQITLSPATTTLVEGGSKQFSAIGKASDGSTVGVSPAFTATGGTVTPAGVYTAGMNPGSFRVIATDPVTSVADTAAVTVTVPAATLQSIILTPSTVSLSPGGTQQFAASGKMSDGSTATVPVTFAATGGAISSSGMFTAGTTTGTYRVTATDPQSGLADSAQVTIAAAAPTLQSVVLTPATVSLTPGGKQQFVASGKMSDGSTSPITASFTATGGTVTGTGYYTAGATLGNFRVIASDQASGKADTAAVTIASAVASVTVSPASVSLTVGQTSQLTATVKDASGTVLTGQSVSWASSNTAAATVSSAGLVSAVGAGSATITATSNGKQDQASVSVTAPPPSSSEGCPSSGYTRLVAVGTASQLLAALGAAQPGDQIRLASGTYAIGQTTITRSGTAASPITLCGPRTAVVANGAFTALDHQANHWTFQNFTLTGGIDGIVLTNANYNTLDGLLVQHVQNEGIMLHFSKHNTITGNTVRETGEGSSQYGEGIYIGNGSTNADPADSNLVDGNTLGPNIRSEHVDVKHGTTGNVIQNNQSDATGFQYLRGMTDAVYITGGNGTRFTGNTVMNIPTSSVNGMQVYNGNSNIFHQNSVSGGFGTAYSITNGTGNVVYCDNSKNGSGAFSNTTCTQ